MISILYIKILKFLKFLKSLRSKKIRKFPANNYHLFSIFEPEMSKFYSFYLRIWFIIQHGLLQIYII
jgi:hypothetical protein